MFNNKTGVYVYAGMVAMATHSEAKTEYLGPNPRQAVIGQAALERHGTVPATQSVVANQAKKKHH